jgi:hypothetical protein
MEPILDIPAPEAGDSETVVSSLETAAIFGAKGDGAEALRWLQRAAESASESGDDARTLALARNAATLSSRLNGTPELEGRRLPAPPSRPAASPEEGDDAKPFMLEARSRPPPPSSRPTATGTPPPPSARTRPASLAPAKPPKPSNGTSTASGSRPASKSVTPSVLGAPPAAASAPKSPAQVAPADAPATRTSGRRARQAARVSVTRSLTERGLYFVRVLDEGLSVPDDAFEGLLVSNDVNQTLV